MSDRTINFGDSEADSRYQVGDDAPTGGDFIVVRDLDNNLIPLQYDYAATQLLSGVGLDLGGNDLSNAGAVTADALEASVSLSGPTASEGDVVTLPDNPDTIPVFFDTQTGEPLYPDLEKTI